MGVPISLTDLIVMHLRQCPGSTAREIARAVPLSMYPNERLARQAVNRALKHLRDRSRVRMHTPNPRDLTGFPPTYTLNY